MDRGQQQGLCRPLVGSPPCVSALGEKPTLGTARSSCWAEPCRCVLTSPRATVPHPSTPAAHLPGHLRPSPTSHHTSFLPPTPPAPLHPHSRPSPTVIPPSSALVHPSTTHLRSPFPSICPSVSSFSRPPSVRPCGTSVCLRAPVHRPAPSGFCPPLLRSASITPRHAQAPASSEQRPGTVPSFTAFGEAFGVWEPAQGSLRPRCPADWRGSTTSRSAARLIRVGTGCWRSSRQIGCFCGSEA